MHKYLKALGFDNIQTRSDLKKLLEEVEEQCTHQTIVSYKPGEDFCELKKEYISISSNVSVSIAL